MFGSMVLRNVGYHGYKDTAHQSYNESLIIVSKNISFHGYKKMFVTKNISFHGYKKMFVTIV